MNEELEALRLRVEELSLDLLALLNERAASAGRIARLKEALGLPLRDPQREDLLLGHLVAANRGPFDDATVRALFRHVIDAGVALSEGRQRRGLRVGTAGGPAVVVTVRGHSIGGGAPAYVAGPCSVESEEQIHEAAAGLWRLGVRFLRGGAFKPRSSPYAFQGLGAAGLELLAAAARAHGMVSVTEATSPANVELVARHADIVQIGARNMANFELLRAVGQTRKPVILKRGFGATIDEWLNAAEYVAVSGSEEIVLCERGIRTFSADTRSTLDLSAVPLALLRSRLPVMVDVSHAAGRRDILAPLAAAAFGAGAHAVMVEVHPDPDMALSDAEQQLTLGAFAALQREVVATLSRTATLLGAPTANGTASAEPARPLTALMEASCDSA